MHSHFRADRNTDVGRLPPYEGVSHQAAPGETQPVALRTQRVSHDAICRVAIARRSRPVALAAGGAQDTFPDA